MGLLDSVIGGALGALQGQGGQGGAPDLLQLVVGLLGNNSPVGGLGGLVQQLQQGGLGDAVQSWIGTGANLPVSAEALQGALGSDLIGQLAQQTGLNTGDLAGQLSQLLPQVVDKLTPNGALPAAGAMAQPDLGSLLGGLSGLLNR
ncbi:YidB family protein [Aquabacterium sp. OR-4]|uniref:YidB family protein n=1 Tax=Aquabacterium sp. OR-4 TaxID=2978127 RepID=UPI0021B43C14|nr:YidB family protein [Aquabacterium sp. OR-4]MDT7833978.1 YidB family protein [Aquabacterium sp. OR-4]